MKLVNGETVVNIILSCDIFSMTHTVSSYLSEDVRKFDSKFQSECTMCY